MAILEVCVDSARGLAEAIAGGADRIELCAALELGGLTPGPGLMGLAAESGLPIMAMIRPRPGDFVFDRHDLRACLADIAAARAMGMQGVVIGASLADGRLDTLTLRTLAAEAEGMEIVLHRSIDLCPDAVAAVLQAIELGVTRILSSGGAARAVEGLGRLAAMGKAAEGRLSILPGSGITAENVGQIVAALGVTEVHASCARQVPQSAPAIDFGFAGPQRKETDAAEVRRLKSALQAALGLSPA